MSEWSNVPVLKTGEGYTSWGSNPHLPATTFIQSCLTATTNYPERHNNCSLLLHLKNILFFDGLKVFTKTNALLYAATSSKINDNT